MDFQVISGMSPERFELFQHSGILDADVAGYATIGSFQFGEHKLPNLNGIMGRLLALFVICRQLS